MLKKTLVIVSNFFHTLKFKEFIDLFIIPLVLTIIIYVCCNHSIQDKGIIDFNSMVINIMAILGAFSIASLSIIITSSNSNIEFAKKSFTERKDRLNKTVTYYKLQILRNFFCLFILFASLIYGIFLKVFESIVNLKISFYFEVYILIIAIFSEIFVIQSMYFLFVELKKDSN